MKLNLEVDPAEGFEDPRTVAVAYVFQEAFDLYVKKSQDYGTAWVEQGYMGNLARMMSKVSRLKNMLWRNELVEKSTEESSRETALDLLVLSAFFVVNQTDDNAWGRS